MLTVIQIKRKCNASTNDESERILGSFRRLFLKNKNTHTGFTVVEISKNEQERHSQVSAVYFHPELQFAVTNGRR